jgi:8-oxo-dGTP pyrophosphatase MutT (NUDIX family)
MENILTDVQDTFNGLFNFMGQTTNGEAPKNGEHKEVQTTFSYNDIKLVAKYPHIQPHLGAIAESPKFKKWLDDFKRDEITVSEFHITDVDFFGPPVPSKLGFVKGHGIAFDKASGDPIPAIAFVRGAAVAVLIVVSVVETGKKHILMCKQLRFPSGGALVEACAGMIDDRTRNVVGVVFNEVKQETGFTVKEDELIGLGQIIPSGGGCDEIVYLYAWETECTESQFEEKKSKVFGEGSHEKIKLLFYDFDTFDDEIDEVSTIYMHTCIYRS